MSLPPQEPPSLLVTPLIGSAGEPDRPTHREAADSLAVRYRKFDGGREQFVLAEFFPHGGTCFIARASGDTHWVPFLPTQSESAAARQFADRLGPWARWGALDLELREPVPGHFLG
jgi:hypothetical protein